MKYLSTNRRGQATDEEVGYGVKRSELNAAAETEIK